MIRSILAAVIGGVATWLFLVLWDATDFTTPTIAYFLAGVVSAVGTLLWPVVVLFFLRRRRKNKQEAAVQAEVDRQLAQKS
jgi:hypothetical protein